MKLKYLILLPAMSLLSSCGKNELRSDIKDFVASFSLNESMLAYKHAGYTSIKESFINGIKTNETINLTFDIRDLDNASYSLKTTTLTNDENEEIKEKYLTKSEDKYYLNETGKEPLEYSTYDIERLVQDFFYTQVMHEGSYHCNGMYYGDLILETAKDLQNFVKIDQENSLYIYHYITEGDVEGKPSRVEQFYSVNKNGMLVKNISKQSNGENYINQEINVFSL